MARKTKDAEKQVREKAEQVRERAEEARDQAKQLAGAGGEAVRDFADTTGKAARQFAQTALDAAKDLLETVEKAGDRLEQETKPKRRRGRKVLKAGLALGVGAALLANDKVRNTITGVFRGDGDAGEDPWQTSAGDGEAASPAPQTSP